MYKGLVGDSPVFERSHGEVLARQIAWMHSVAMDEGCSGRLRVPINHALVLAYKEFGEKPKASDVIDFSPTESIEDVASLMFPTASFTRYQRAFKPGQGEGTHTDDHDFVITLTEGATADFTIAAALNSSNELRPYDMVGFNPRLPHEVSAPTSRGHRHITALAIDF